MVAFGVGCWLFEPAGVRLGEKSAQDLALNPELYLASVTSSLASIPSVSKIKTSTALEFQYFPFEEREDSEDDGEHWALQSSTFIPQISKGFINFSVHIPVSVQKSLLESNIDIGENFRVQMKFRKDFPVTFIICEDTDIEITRPSHAMIIVREFLRSELKLRNSPVKLRVLGPSPFWADFFVVPKRTSAQSFKAVEKKPIEYLVDKYPNTYSDITCYWHTSQFSDSVQAVRTVFQQLTPELSLYYAIVAKRSVRVRKSWKINGLLDQLIDYYDTQKFLIKLARFFKAGKFSRSLILEVRLIQLLANKQKLRFSRELEDLYSDENAGILKEFLESEISESVAGEDLGTENLAQLFESRRSSEVSLFMLIVASLLGGLAGAVFNGLITK